MCRRESSSRFSSCGTQLLFAVSNYDSFGFFFLCSKYSLYKQQSLFKCQNASIFGSRHPEPLLTLNPSQVLMAFSPTVSSRNIYSIHTLLLFLQKSMSTVHCKVVHLLFRSVNIPLMPQGCRVCLRRRYEGRSAHLAIFCMS